MELEKQNERIDEHEDSGAAAEPQLVSLNDMQSYSSIASASRDSSASGNIRPLEITEPRPPERQGTEPREISEKEYKQLAEEIRNTGKIPERLKNALEQQNGNGPVIDLQKLNDLIQIKNMKLTLTPLPGGRDSLELIQNGKVIDAYKSSGLGLPPSHERPRPQDNSAPELPRPGKIPGLPYPSYPLPYYEPKKGALPDA